jgi:cyanophycin synthetase
MRVLGEFVDGYADARTGQSDLGKISRIGMVSTAGDRRDDDMRELGAVAARHFDVIVVREDTRLRGRPAGQTAGLIVEGAKAEIGKEGVRCRQVETVLTEVDAVRHCLARANPGDVVVLCVDQHAEVVAELEQMTKSAQPGAHAAPAGVGDPDLDPAELQSEAQASGNEAAVASESAVETGAR